MNVTGIDHIYLMFSDFERSVRFYDRVMQLLGFRKGNKAIAGDAHAHYFNPSVQLSIRPARRNVPHDPYAPGLHHLCLQVATHEDVSTLAAGLRRLGVEASEPKLYPEYDPDTFATFFDDPDAIRLEIVARTPARDEIARHWSQFTAFQNPLAEFRARKR